MNGNGSDTPSPQPKSRPVVDWNNRTQIRDWLFDLREQVRDIAAVADDATRPPNERRLGRHAAREMCEEAERAVDQLFDAAMRGLFS